MQVDMIFLWTNAAAFREFQLFMARETTSRDARSRALGAYAP